MSVQRDERLPARLEQLHVGIVLYDPETGAVLDVNGRIESLFGYDVATLREMTVDEYSANTQTEGGEQFREWLRAAAAGEPQQCRWRVKRADGELIWTEIRLSRYGGSECVIAEVFDVTDYYAATRRVGLFSRVLRHNLRNDVTVIAGRAENIRTETDERRVQADAATIRRKAGEVARLTESVKQIDRAMAETVADRTLENATDAVAEVIERLRERYPDASVTVTERDEMWVHIDDAFDHALTHAVDNAIRHDDGDPTVEVTVGASPNTGRVEIRVADTAPPIPDTELDAIDDLTQTTTTAHGSGTGLFVMKWCVESLGGELRFDRHDDGNVVTIYLPPKKP
ncbi:MULTISPECIES: PAS domain-containing sensor histidine kinase [Haloarcula]|uniref:PAS domain-containing sensor histidine kinase n=1 Tax=Haloarcula TaxID=2237 RepID=UPI0023ECBEBA|nr:PAS domain-containing sensor histidine kinase [Halomicroarcula sp. XH51]